MAITADTPFKGRQHPGEVSVLCVGLYLRYPLSYEHVAELAAERGVEVDASCIWRWVQALRQRTAGGRMQTADFLADSPHSAPNIGDQS